MRWIGLPALVLALLCPAAAVQNSLPLNTIKLPPAFQIDIYAEGVENARSMALSPGGILYVGTRTKGNVYAVVDQNKDQRADRVYTLATGLQMPNGVAFKDGALYLSEVNRVTRNDGIDARLASPPPPVVIHDRFPTERHHGWKFIAFGPDGKLYVPVGAPCNICESGDPRFASITRMNPDGSGPEVFASGVRNTVGFDWHPSTKEMWFTENGRDSLGGDIPPDELNHAPKADLPTLGDLVGYKQQGINIWAPPTFALLDVDSSNRIVPSQAARDAKAAGLDLITWTLERSGLLTDNVPNGFYYQTFDSAISREGDLMRVIDVLARDVGILGVFSDWPAAVTYYANCMG